MQYLGKAYKCGSCGSLNFNELPWDCPVCGKEICEYCFSYYATCKKCCKNKTIEEIKNIAIEAGYDEFN